MTTWSGERTASRTGLPCGLKQAHTKFPRKEQRPKTRESVYILAFQMSDKTFVWASMNIFVNMSVMRRSSVPESILQTSILTNKYRFKTHLPSLKKHWRPISPSFLSAQWVDAQLAIMSVMSLKCIWLFCRKHHFGRMAFVSLLAVCADWTMKYDPKAK